MLGAKMHAMIKKAKNKASLVLLLLTLISVIFLHVEWATSENGTLLVVDNQEIDLVGAMTNQWIRLTRNCTAVSQLQPTDAKYQRAKSLIKNYSPPNSESAQIASGGIDHPADRIDVRVAVPKIGLDVERHLFRYFLLI